MAAAPTPPLESADGQVAESRAQIAETHQSVTDASTAAEPREDAGPTAIDFAEAIRTCFGSQQILQQMVEFYVCEAPTLLETMRAALAEQNRRKLVSAECRLRKTLVHLAARPAMEAAERLEQRVIEGQWVERTELLAELTYHLERLDAALRASLARNSKLL